jgi:hypothetical protein
MAFLKNDNFGECILFEMREWVEWEKERVRGREGERERECYLLI